MSNQSFEALMRELRPIAEQMQRLSERIAATLPPKWEFKATKMPTGGHLHIEKKPLPTFDPEPKDEPAKTAVVTTSIQLVEVDDVDFWVVEADVLVLKNKAGDTLASFAVGMWEHVRWAGDDR